jgi:ATP-dependent helicase HrpB
VRITEHGKQMAELPMHPRLSHMLIRAGQSGATSLACDVAALLGERDPVRSEQASLGDADIETRIALIRGSREPVLSGQSVDRDAIRRIRAEADRLRTMLRADKLDATASSESAGSLLALAYPDRIGQLRAPRSGRFLLRNGNGATLAGAQSLSDSSYVVVAELDGRRPESRVFLAASVDLTDIERLFGDQITLDEEVVWDERTRAVVAREREMLGAIILAERPIRSADPARVADALLVGIRHAGIDALPWSDGARSLRQRLAFLHAVDATWPDVSDEHLTQTLGTWLAPHLGASRSVADLSRIDLAGALLGDLPWDRRAAIDELAPTHLVVPSGSRIPIDYSDPTSPILAVRLQEMFGLAETPTVARGAVPLTIHLLSPAHRPVQVTKDLAGFWRSSYFDVRKEMRGRYPKHYWPDDPMQAEPTRRAKPR